jgi:hypothetical protein
MCPGDVGLRGQLKGWPFALSAGSMRQWLSGGPLHRSRASTPITVNFRADCKLPLSVSLFSPRRELRTCR